MAPETLEQVERQSREIVRQLNALGQLPLPVEWRPVGDREDPVRLVFDAEPGPAVVVGICDLGDRFRLVLNEVTVVPPDVPLPRLLVARAVWEPHPDLATSAECWLAAGGRHHTVLSCSVGTEELSDFAAMMGTELVLIDADTTPRQFGNELRWNAAYHLLRLGR